MFPQSLFSEMNKMQYFKICENILLHGIIYNIFQLSSLFHRKKQHISRKHYRKDTEVLE